MRNSRILHIARTVATLGMFALVTTAADCSDPTSPGDGAEPTVALRAPTTNAAFASAHGEAKFENQGGERELEIEVEDIPAGTALVFYIGDVEVARVTADALGHARINLNSDRGGNVPVSVSGQSITVKTPEGVVVVTGTF
jgi:hypothetical protein